VIVALRREFMKLPLSRTTCRGGAINAFRSWFAGARGNASEYCQPQSPEAADKQAVKEIGQLLANQMSTSSKTGHSICLIF
jgi:hypothetical protein